MPTRAERRAQSVVLRALASGWKSLSAAELMALVDGAAALECIEQPERILERRALLAQVAQMEAVLRHYEATSDGARAHQALHPGCAVERGWLDPHDCPGRRGCDGMADGPEARGYARGVEDAAMACARLGAEYRAGSGAQSGSDAGALELMAVAAGECESGILALPPAGAQTPGWRSSPAHTHHWRIVGDSVLLAWPEHQHWGQEPDPREVWQWWHIGPVINAGDARLTLDEAKAAAEALLPGAKGKP